MAIIPPPRAWIGACVIQPLCTDIETDLRLQIHTGVVKLDDRNPFRVPSVDLRHFLLVR